MSVNLALVNLDDLRVLLSENGIKNEVWGAKEASAYLKVSIPQLTKQTRAGIIPGVKIGAEWKFSSIALYEFVAKKQTS